MNTLWNPLWNDIFRSRSWGSYPEDALIRFIATNYYKRSPRSECSILDLGCGTGASTWYLCREGFCVTAVDGAAEGVELVRKRLENEGLSAALDVADIAALTYAPESFDCIVDVACLMCNGYADVKALMPRLKSLLKPGGKLFSFTARDGCWGDGIGRPLGHNTYIDSQEGPFARMGTVRFSNEQGIREIYGCFPKISLDYVERSIESRKHIVSHWVVTCERE
jgi:SAM-dependent methyltransferase